MGIKFNEKSKSFKLDAKDTSYVISVVDDKYIGHVYYGKKIIDDNINYLMRLEESPFVPSNNKRDEVCFFDSFASEYSTNGIGDFRETSLSVIDKNGNSMCKLEYQKHEIVKGKPKTTSMPMTFGNSDECTTLNIYCIDPVLQLEVVLVYTVFENYNAITRNVCITNKSNDDIRLTKMMSMCIDFDDTNYDMITLHGGWARERNVVRRKVNIGKQGISSRRGESSHQDSPFVAIVDCNSDEEIGNVYGFSLVYSGNHFAQVEGCQFNTTRFVMGINHDDFSWLLTPNETFVTPEVVMVYSSNGIGEMSRTFHDVYRNNLIRSKYKNIKRPVLINNWEATYFDFDDSKLLDIARESSKLGIEMLVMDDGWFGKRNDDNTSLGDWFVNTDKIKGGLKNLVDEVNKLGMKFGIWLEPEMISVESELYKNHPDWCIHIQDRDHSMCRNQLVLDLTRVEIRDYIYSMIKELIQSANIEYVKWDMNRQLTNIGSAVLDKDRQSEIFHRYVLGVYDLMERLVTDFPDILLENCSGGGGRFDAGMLYYSPQIWASDDTDAIERLKIQHGTSLIFPVSSIGAHVSVCPNHTVGRNTPFETRGHVALSGTFGYELDVTKLSEEDKQQIPKQIEMYNKYNDIIREGDLYRLLNVFDDNLSCVSYVAKDKSDVLVNFVQILQRPNLHSYRVKLQGLEEATYYKNCDTNEIYSGGALMYAGILIKGLYGDYASKIIHFQKV